MSTKNRVLFPVWELLKKVFRTLAVMRIVFNLCFSNEVFTVADRKKPFSTNGKKPTLQYLLPDLPPNSKLIFYIYPKLKIMKTISTFVSLMLIIITCASSAVLFLNENYNLSAVLCFVWIISLTLWIGKSMGLVELILNKYMVKNA